MNQKVPCSKCGVLILESTALRTNGLCIPCKSGYRERIEARRRQLREDRETTENDPYRRLWVSLVEQGYRSPTGFDGLSHPQRLYFAVGLLEGEVYNGGFEQYFQNDSGSYYAYAEEGLIALGALQTLALLRQAREVLLPRGAFPVDTRERQRELVEGYLSTPAWRKILDDLDHRYWANSENIALRLDGFARNHGLVP